MSAASGIIVAAVTVSIGSTKERLSDEATPATMRVTLDAMSETTLAWLFVM